MYKLRQIDFDADYELIQQFNRTAKFPITSPLLDTDELDEYYGEPSIEGFILGILDGNKLASAIQCSTAGFLALDGDSAFMFLNNQDIVFSIETLPEFRHRGYANKLLQSAFALAPDSLFVGVIAHEDITNEKLKTFYRNAGFDVSKYEDALVVYLTESNTGYTSFFK